MKRNRNYRGSLEVLLIEDSAEDAALILRILRKEFAVKYQRVYSELELQNALTGNPEWDLVLCDYTLPGFNGLSALETVRRADNDLPFVFVSGTIGEETAVEAMRAGAQDYLMKDNLKRLVPVVRRELEEAHLRKEKDRQEKQLRGILESAPDAVLSTNSRGVILYANDSAEFIFKLKANQILGQNIQRFLPEFDLSGIIADSHSEADGGTKGLLKTHDTGNASRGNGESFPAEVSVSRLEDGKGRLYTLIVRDVTERKLMQDNLAFLAHHDELTGLVNRRMLMIHLEQSIAFASRKGEIVAVLVIDLDKFKNVNDSLGHASGDALLVQVAQRLNSCIRSTDCAARMGGDEFSVILTGIATAGQVTPVVKKLLQVLQQPFPLSGHEVEVNACIGISIYPQDGDTGDRLIRNADNAMYRAKREVSEQYLFYQSWMMTHAKEHMALESELRQALKSGELLLFYQPIVDLFDGRINAVEALLRWFSPGRGEIPPDRFLPLAEESGLIVQLGEWAFAQACLQANAWHREGLTVKLAVNVSARQFHERDFVSSYTKILKETGASAGRIELEITESVLMLSGRYGPEAALHELRRHGFRIALDDFGTGYSSLSYLHRFPVDTLKIDKLFVNQITQNNDKAVIARTIIAMAKQLGLGIVAEGVETKDQALFLLQEGCQLGQGYHFHQPLCADEVTTLLRKALKAM
jgi:diguanylate cyclase (GGDEF)-like protein/PAS domain S-box-containing protein